MTRKIKLTESELIRVIKKAIKEQEDTGGEDQIQGISISLLHPKTQQVLTSGRKMNVYEIIMMLAGCQENKENSPYSILSPMGLSSSSNDNPMVSFENKKFCMVYQGRGSMCFDNVCKLGPNRSAWPRKIHQLGDDLVPALKKYMEGSTIDNGWGWEDDDTTSDNYSKGGDMLRWVPDSDSMNAKWTLTKI